MSRNIVGTQMFVEWMLLSDEWLNTDAEVEMLLSSHGESTPAWAQSPEEWLAAHWLFLKGWRVTPKFK